MGFHEIFHENFTRPQSHGIRLLDLDHIRGAPIKQLQFLALGQNSWEREGYDGPIRRAIKKEEALRGVIKLKINQ